MSILPDRSRAGSSFSTWFVVNTKILSLPQQDHNPSVKFSRPESVRDFTDAAAEPGEVEGSSPGGGGCATTCGELPRLVRETEQSMSSITMIDFEVVFMRSFRSSELV